jgi:Spy/CpxP family protein refolding chaperone
MRKQVLVLVGLVAATGVAFAAAPGAPGRPEGPDGRRGPRMEGRRDMKEALGINDAQAAELKKLRSEQQKKHVRHAADMRVAQMELRELLLAQTVDEKAVRAKAKQIADLHVAAANERVEAQLALRKVLNAEQAEKVMKAMGRRHGREGMRDGKRERGQGKGHGPRHRRGPRAADGEQPEENGDASDL